MRCVIRRRVVCKKLDDRFICFYVDKIAKTRKNIKKRERKETPLEYIRFVYYILLLDDS